ncbi:MAG: hypothetical protein K1X72_17705 [Pyrinomonadaceae bacterium]|nr:hypothetical protein [Pyrinomonadaceae bacterium]
MKKVVILIPVILLFTLSSFAQTKIRLNFTTEKKLFGTVKASKYVDYVFRVKRNSSIEVIFSSADKKLSYAVRNPDGNLIDDESENKNFIGFASKQGDYTVRVFGSKRKVSNFRLKIKFLK